MATRLPIFMLACAAVLSAQTPAQTPAPAPAAPAAQAPAPKPAQAGERKPAAAPAPAPAEEVAPEPKRSFIRRFSVMLRIEGLMSNLMENRINEFESGDDDYKYETKQDSPRMGIGFGLEYRLRPNMILSADYLRHTVSYTQTTTITDENSKTETYKEYTRATYWDLPVRLQVFGPGKLPKWAFLSAGGVIRRARNLRTGNDTTYIDGSTAYNENPTSPAHGTIKGVTAGFGARFADDYGIKIVPEIRYTYWSGKTFDVHTTNSRTSQIQFMIGIGF